MRSQNCVKLHNTKLATLYAIPVKFKIEMCRNRLNFYKDCEVSFLPLRLLHGQENKRQSSH